jgi:hypothetical protein
MLRVTRLRSALASPPSLFALASIAIALVSLWTISIPKAGATATFGFQSPICWLVVLALLGALLLPNLALNSASVLAAELLLIAWYAWTIWLVTTPTYSSQYAFVGTDIVGPAWYAAASGLLFAAALVADRYRDSDQPARAETWLLAAVPGYGLHRLGKSTRGLVWTVLVATTLVLASLDSPIAPLFQPLNGLPDLPDPLPTRGPSWILLVAAALLAALSVVDTIRAKRRLGQR